MIWLTDFGIVSACFPAPSLPPHSCHLYRKHLRLLLFSLVPNSFLPVIVQSTRYQSRSRHLSNSSSASSATLAPDIDSRSFQRLSIETSNERAQQQQVVAILYSDDEEIPNARNHSSRSDPPSISLRQDNADREAADQDEEASVLQSIEFGNDAVVIDLTEEDEIEAGIIWEEEEAELRRLAVTDIKEKYPTRNKDFTLPFVEVERFSWKGTTLRHGKTIELNNGSFIRIITIVENLSNGEVRIRGWLLKKNTELDGLIPWQRNELCYIFEVDQNDPRPATKQCVEDVGIEEVFRIRRVIFTNHEYPAFNNWEEIRDIGRRSGKGWGEWAEE